MSDNNDEKNKFSPKPGDAGQPKRPHATIDLKATDITSGSGSARADGVADKTGTAGAAATIANAARVEIKKTETAGGAKPGAVSGTTSVPGSSASMGYGQTSKSAAAAVGSNGIPVSEVAGRRGVVIPMLGAGLTGGVLALLGSTFGPSLLGLTDMMQTQQELNPAAQRRIVVIEQALRDRPVVGGDVTSKVGAIESRIGKIEESARTLADGQTRLAEVARTLGDRTGPKAIDEAIAVRLQKLEEQLRLVAAAADDPQRSGRVPQLAQITGKLSDLENALNTATTTLRRDVAKDVETRIVAANEASEAARSGAQRIDRELAGVKTETARIGQRTQSLELSLKSLSEDAGGMKAALDALKGDLGGRAKPDDVKAALAPVATRIETLEKNVQGVVRGEQDRNITAERIVLSLELANLKRALDRGGKFANELAAVKKLAAGKLNLTALEAAQNDSLPTLAALGTEFRTLANAMLDADAEPSDAGVVDRLLSGAKSIVRVRKVNHSAGDTSAEAVIGRMEAAVKDGRLSDVLEGAKSLSAKVAAPAQGWLKKVEGRYSVEKALADIETQLKGSLAGGVEPKKGNN